MTRDLTDILKFPVVNAEDFVYTNNITTMIAIVPKSSKDLWKNNYELWGDYVVPQSTKMFPFEDEKDGFTLWRVVLWKSTVTEYQEKCRQNKIIVREFNYNAQASSEKEKLKHELKAQTEGLSTTLLGKCVSHFSELYQGYLHMKVLKLLIDCVMRFGIKEPVVTGVIRPLPGKEKKTPSIIDKITCRSKEFTDGSIWFKRRN